MSDDQQIAFPANRPDNCSAEQPIKDDAAAATCPVQPPKDDSACPVQPPKDDSACPVQPPKDDAACPVSSPNFETEMSDAVLMSKDDDAASLAPPPNNDASLALPLNDDAGLALPPNDDASFAPVPKIDDGPASPPKEEASPASPPKEDANPACPLMDDIADPACLSPSPMDETVPLVPKVDPEFSKANGLENADMYDDGVQLKHEIKHETIDLGNDPYFYEESNRATLVGFDRGLEPDHIIGATEVNGQLMFLVAWQNSEDADLLKSTEVYNKCPQLAIQFFEARLRYCPNKQ